MKHYFVVLVLCLFGCQKNSEQYSALSSQALVFKNQLLQEQIMLFCREHKLNPKRCIITVSTQSLENRNEYVIASTINNPLDLTNKCIAYSSINGYLVVFGVDNVDIFDNSALVNNLLHKIKEMNIVLSDKFLLYESKMCIIKMNFENNKIITKECT
ncbi:hypothetical protein IC235_06045 [Hymenobacter sp. BT664]|uniref:Uncharacterized protein n=1 Tax=Hymenobacter montanus TaxID=2771359 RepID=A0A927BB17_9BACT|nr:hypothetical protein [Hymenobacter montanus]MBD2767450.1 hypothetical protein [Hymenobacter montanus]